MFFEEPVGKHLLHVCKNVSCMLRGGDELIEALVPKTAGETGRDDCRWGIYCHPFECLGACDRAPMMLVDDKVVGPVKKKIDQILTEAKKGQDIPPV